ncbi:MAG: TIGR02757 family protein [Salibacteraceae bacterium]
MKTDEMRQLLEAAYEAYARPDFLENDPIKIPHRYSKKEDVEISGFLAATIAWGNRTSIINNAKRLMHYMDDSPADFISHHKPQDRQRLKGFVHRTFNETDVMYFFERLQRLYRDEGGLEDAFGHGPTTRDRISNFHQIFFDHEFPQRTTKHVSNPAKGSSAKRLNMYLRWMVRPNTEKVDFGIWKSMHPKDLMMPLDVHTGNVGRTLKLLHRKQNDWKAVSELTEALRKFDPNDPVKYDYALFGMGVNKV